MYFLLQYEAHVLNVSAIIWKNVKIMNLVAWDRWFPQNRAKTDLILDLFLSSGHEFQIDNVALKVLDELIGIFKCLLTYSRH